MHQAGEGLHNAIAAAWAYAAADVIVFLRYQLLTVGKILNPPLETGGGENHL
jgi:hypothetical protein